MNKINRCVYNNNTFGNRLYLLIEDLGITQYAFAKSVYMAPNTISNYINGLREPTSGSLIRICETYNVSADWLLGFSDNKKMKIS